MQNTQHILYSDFIVTEAYIEKVTPFLFFPHSG
jgi:hypothetical protein